MPLFKYQAKNNAGVVYGKTIEAENRFKLYDMIREEGGQPLSIKEVNKVSFHNVLGGLFGGIKTSDKIFFAKNLGAMIRAGLPVTRALSVMEKQSKKSNLKKLFSGLAEELNRGETLSDAMKKKGKVFPSIFIAMVRAGEESGNVAQALDVIGNQMEKSYALTKKVRGALIYPAVIISIMVLISILMLIFMVPTLQATFEGLNVELPLSTRIIIGASDFLITHTLLFFLGVLVVIASIASFVKSERGKKVIDRISIKVPIVGLLMREVQSARTARTLSSLLSAGVSVVPALAVTIDVVQNHLYKEALRKAQAAIEKGEPMSAVFSSHEHLYPVFVGEMVAVGEETGKISEMLVGVADFYEEEVNQKTKDLSTIIEPILMVIIGAGVGLFAISMLAPTYSLVDYI